MPRRRAGCNEIRTERVDDLDVGELADGSSPSDVDHAVDLGRLANAASDAGLVDEHADRSPDQCRRDARR